LRLFDVVFSSEPFYAARGINKLLFTGKKRVAGGTNFHLDILYRRTGFDNIPAGAGYRGFFISGMNLVSHKNPLLYFPVQFPAAFKTKTARMTLPALKAGYSTRLRIKNRKDKAFCQEFFT
jgi:hypothetical protein